MDLNSFTPPGHMQFDGNLREHWKKWKQELDFYLAATEKDKKNNKVKSSILLTCIGAQGREIYNTFTFEDDEEKMNFDVLIKKFDEHCLPKKNITLVRHKFFTYNQKEGQSFHEFVIQLKRLSSDCEFGELKDSLIRDTIIIGIRDERLKERMLREPDLDLSKALLLGNSAEQTRNHVKELKQEVAEIDSIKKTPSNNRNIDRPIIENCRYCGGSHRRGSCPAYGQTCNKCKKSNHFAKVCQAKPKRVETIETNDFFLDSIELKINETKPTEEEEYYIDSISGDNEWRVNLNASDTNICFKIDSGAHVNVISRKQFYKLKTRPSIKNSNIKLTAYNGSSIPITGCCILNIKHLEKTYPLLFVIVDIDSVPILGLKASEKLNLIKRIHTIDMTSEILDQYDDCFDEIGTLPKVHRIIIDESVPPVVHSSRKIPIALKDEVKEELNRMMRLNVIEPVIEPTDWVNQIVVARKPNGKLRMCLDPRDLNKAVKRHHFKLPTAEELFAEMKGAKYFTKLDASSGYWQIKVDEESSKLLTFATPFGRYKYKRLPFGIHSASEIFQQNVAEIIEGCEGARNSQDDIIIWGATKDELRNRTIKVLEKTRKAGLRLNKAKCKICVDKVIFLGHQISAEGISPCPDKVRAIIELPKPTCKADLQRFLGMTAYLAKFIPKLSEETATLRELLKKNNNWDFTPNHDIQFEKIKEIISRDISLKFFDPDLPTKITCDSSKIGLGATLEQQYPDGWHPIAFKSRVCSPAEKNYCPLEREALAIVFGCTSLHEYLYGRQFIVESDHKSLKTIFKYNINEAPPRIQRFLLQLQKYDFNVNYIPGKDLILSDTLSRAPSGIDTSEINEEEITAQINTIVSSLPVSTCRMNQIKEETNQDPTMLKLITMVQTGWPDDRSLVPDEIKPYFNHRNELSVINGIVMKGTRIVIPANLRNNIKRILHTGHLGIERTKMNARSTLFWPNMNEELSEMIRNCDSCQKFRKCQLRESLIQHDIPSRPWVKVGTDLFTLFNKTFLVIVDYTSKFFEVINIPNAKSETVINYTKSIFSRHGIPSIVISDNGPEFSSRRYKQFAKQWDFLHKTSSPEYPQSNGLVERTIQTIKQSLRKCYDDGSDPYLAMLALRTSVNSTNSSAAFALMNRNPRTLIPTCENTTNLQPRDQQHKHSVNLPPLQTGDIVRFRDKNSTQWNRMGVVVNKHNTAPRSYNIHTDIDTKIRRNRRHLLQSSRSTLDVKEDIHFEEAPNTEAFNKKTPNTDTSNGAEVTTRDEVSTPNEVPTQNEVRTRSGRLVVKPERYRQ